MSRDATGIWSRRAVETYVCPVCRAGKGWACNVDVPGYSEHDTHFQRTEDAPSDPVRADPSFAWRAVVIVLGREPDLDSDDDDWWVRYDELAELFKVAATEAVADAAMNGAEGMAAQMRAGRDEVLARILTKRKKMLL